MHAHDELAWEELLQLERLEDEMVLRDDVELFEVLILLHLLQDDLLFSISFLKPPELFKVRLANENDLRIVLHHINPAER